MVDQKKKKSVKEKVEKHLFALYVYDLTQLLKNSTDALCIQSESFFHRITRVLRIPVGQEIIIFDQNTHAIATVLRYQKRDVDFSITSCFPNRETKPLITFGLPLLKREAIEHAIYLLTEIGVTHIQLIHTEKSGSRWSKKEYDRAQRIMIAAAEQSKNYAFPKLKDPVSLTDFVDGVMNSANIIFFDPMGKPAFDVFATYKETKPQQFALIIGPEGDLTTQEKDLLTARNVTFCALTPTILQAKDAGPIGAALVRCLLSA